MACEPLLFALMPPLAPPAANEINDNSRLLECVYSVIYDAHTAESMGTNSVCPIMSQFIRVPAEIDVGTPTNRKHQNKQS